jgi:hypothetical protein
MAAGFVGVWLRQRAAYYYGAIREAQEADWKESLRGQRPAGAEYSGNVIQNFFAAHRSEILALLQAIAAGLIVQFIIKWIAHLLGW